MPSHTSQIIKSASSLKITHKQSIIQFISQAGVYKHHKRGPYLYGVTVTLNPMYTTSGEFRAISKEIRDSGYSENTIETRLPGTYVYNVGNWSEASGGSGIQVDGAGQTGNTINLKGFTPNGEDVIADGDYLQFNTGNKNKVYQAIGNFDADATGEVANVKLNTMLATSPSDSDDVINGSSVVFSFVLSEYTDPTLTPITNNKSLAQWGEFTFSEVL